MIMDWDLAVSKHSRLRERETEALNLLACFPRTFVPWLRARERERERESRHLRCRYQGFQCILIETVQYERDHVKVCEQIKDNLCVCARGWLGWLVGWGRITLRWRRHSAPLLSTLPWRP